jgi:hypothetical protein
MASLDDIYDMIEKLDNSDTEYLFINIQKGKKNGKADVFYNLKDDAALKVLSSGLKIFMEQIDKDGFNK